MNDTRAVINRVAEALESLGVDPDSPGVRTVLGEFHELLARNANLRNFLAVCEAQKNAVVKLCYHEVDDGFGHFYRLDVDVPPDTEIDYDTADEAADAVVAAAKYRTPEAF